MSQGNSGIEGEGGNFDKFVDPTAAAGNGDGGTIRDSAGNEFDPTIHSGPGQRNRDGSFRRKRGRKSGGGNSKSRSQVHSDIKESAEFLARAMVIFHSSMAAMTKTPELELEYDEALGVSTSGLTLAAMYDITPDPKLQAAIIFAGQIGMTYGSRIVAIRARQSQEKKERRKGTAGMYDADGKPIGTTSFTSGEWPIEPEVEGMPIN